MFTVTRSPNNPLLSPNEDHPWEASAAFNGCAIASGKDTYIVYRGMSGHDLLKEPHIKMSVIGRATSTDDGRFADKKVLISPDADFDRFGCEDPRVTEFGGKYYIFYTALGDYPYSADNIKVAVAISKDMDSITEKHLVTPFNAKAMAMFPGKIGGKMAALLTINTDRKPADICYAEFEKPEDIWSGAFWEQWLKNVDAHKLSVRRLPDDQVELGAPPLWTEDGWLVIYSHIQRYGHGDQVFGIEAMLLDHDNPRNILGRTKGPFMVPEAYYEKVGQVANIVFPSGALIKGDLLEVYYGASDTYCAKATIPLDNLVRSMTEPAKPVLARFPGNPIISPRPGYLWESAGTINPAAVDIGGKTSILYRAVAEGNVSTFGYAASSDGLSIDERSDKPVYFPRAAFERRVDGGTTNYGCEDPRIVRIGDRLYMTYTGYDGHTPRVAVSSISLADFETGKWSGWTEPQAITPPGVDDKDAAILPEPVDGRYMIFHRVRESICADFVDSLDFDKEKVTRCIEIIAPRHGMWDGGKVGISAPPIRTKAGWLLLYHGVSWSTTYRVGAVLLDLEDPTIVTARSAVPIFEPEAEYERKGLTPNVVFPCGLVARRNTLYVYYGAADSVIGVATMKLDTILRMLKT
ncbi:MAG: hypothetical protein KGI49_00850 [Patescibacteria group bacterium]|nr:hypothetical protein [Patescibacteria group bacterium]